MFVMSDTHLRIINYCQVFCESSLLCSKSHSLTILDGSHVRCFSLPAGGEDFLSTCEKLITFCTFFLWEALISILHRMTLVKSSAESLQSLPDYPPQEISPKNPLSGWVGGYWSRYSFDLTHSQIFEQILRWFQIGPKRSCSRSLLIISIDSE